MFSEFGKEMLSYITSLCSSVYQKLVSKTSTGTKRSVEDTNDYPPRKQMRLDHNLIDRDESVLSFRNSVESKENFYCEEQDEHNSLAQLSRKKWGTPMMARRSIRKSPGDFQSHSFPSDNEKHRPIFSLHNHNKEHQTAHQTCSKKDNNDVQYNTTNSTLKNNKIEKTKSISEKIFNSLPSTSTSQKLNSLMMSQRRRKKSNSIIEENYQLKDKHEYQNLLRKYALSTFPILKIHPGRNSGSSRNSTITIDLTNEKTNVAVNKLENTIPWTSSSRHYKDISLNSTSPESKSIPAVNSLRDMLLTNPVTSEDFVLKTLADHLRQRSEKRRLAELEEKKVKILHENNQKVYNETLEESLMKYMQITAPALDETEKEEEYTLPELSDEQERKINSALAPSGPNEVLIEKFGLQIKRRDIHTLKGLNWLNDEVINFYMNLIMERGKNENLPKVYAFNTFFYPKLLSGGHSSLKRWTKKVDIFSHDMVLVPVHLGMHWCMAVVDFRNKQVRYYDSMGTPNERCLQALLSYLEAESLDKKKEKYNTKDWEQISVDDIPQQMNGSDCGVFSCMFAEHLARNSPLLFSQDHMPYFRRKMVLEILEAKLLT